jgi:dipeptidyl aminopeptidase/acylaminoacyl peptidase
MAVGKAIFGGAGRLALAALMGCGFGCEAQAGRVYTADDYARAESFMDYNVAPLVYHSVGRVVWLDDGRFWFRDVGPEGMAFTLVDPAKKTKSAAFDQAKVAAALNAAMRAGRLPIMVNEPISFAAVRLPIDDFALEDGDRTLVLTLAPGPVLVRCDLRGKVECKGMGDTHLGANWEAYDLSPDGKTAAFIRWNNLWARDVASGKLTQLTTDGVEDFGYATDNAGWTHSSKPIVEWSPDSKKIATFQLDQRKVGQMTLVATAVGHPAVETWRYPLAGDKDVATIEPVIIDVAAHKVVRLKMPPQMHRSSLCDDVSCSGGHGWDDVQWSEDSAQVALVSTARDHKQEWLRVADAANGEVREVLNERTATYFESGSFENGNGAVNWRYLARSNEAIWFSERDGWGQLYLYDATTGAMKNPITRGVGNVTEVLRVDQQARVIYFLAVGKEVGRDPYYAALYRVNFDGSGMRLLTPEDADHAVTFAPDGKAFADVASTPTMPEVAVVRDDEGQALMEVAREDITKLRATGWQPLTPITVKARDGKTDLFGFLFRPTNFDATKKYPVIDHVYPGPQTGSCGSRSFAAAHGDMQSLAELGFVVVCIDGMGTAGRSKSFHDALYGDLGDNTIPDQVAGIRQLAARYAWIDADRAGIYGHSGGGAAAAAGLLRAPEFFKVGVSESGNHDNRVYEDDWAEKWVGLLARNAGGTTNYDSQANQNYAKNLKGRLLLIHGTMDDNVPPNNTLLVVDALIRANKDFDLLMVPNVGHDYGAATPYVTRRRWDYFVRYLAGGVPLVDYAMKPYADQQAALAIVQAQ